MLNYKKNKNKKIPKRDAKFFIIVYVNYNLYSRFFVKVFLKKKERKREKE